MKIIFNDQRTTTLLRTWSSSGSLPLVTAAFFFWRSGTRLEKSEEGFLRSLLFSVFTQKPEFTPRVLPKEWAIVCASLLRPPEGRVTRYGSSGKSDRKSSYYLLLSKGADVGVTITISKGRRISARHILESSLKQDVTAESW